MVYMGQLVPAPANQGLPYNAALAIKERLNGRQIEVLVTSKNALKMKAATDSVVEWFKALFNEMVEVKATGFGVPSDIDEQPHGLEHTRQGAQNRLNNLKAELLKNNISATAQDGVLRVLVSLENGIMQENIPNVRNGEKFITESGTVWVDRCVEVGEIWLQGTCYHLEAISEGVTTPKAEVAKSQEANWSRTAGSFIETAYGWPSADWHGSIAGKGRKLIMEELAKTALGLPYSIPIPAIMRPFNAERDTQLFLQYNNQSIDFFSPKEIDAMLQSEIVSEKNGIPLNQVEESVFWRTYYQNQIPQPSKLTQEGFQQILGPDGITPINTSGPVLTEDLLVGYFDEVEDPQTHEKKDVLHIVLLFAKDEGWVMPGKRDRAYDMQKADISVQDANYSLVEKEIGVERNHAVANIVLGTFDDRKREERMKTTSIVSFVLLDVKPQMIPGKRIGVPLNGLVQLVKREITIPPYPSYSNHEGKLMGRNHDSLIMSVIQTAAFYSAMEKVKQAQVKFRQHPQAPYPPLSNIDPSYECKICFEILVNVTSVCRNGHDVCGACFRRMQQLNQNCSECRGALDPRPNRSLDEVVKHSHPEQYAKRFKAMTNTNPITWQNDPVFNGGSIKYN